MSYNIQYRFTVTAINICGHGNESNASNILYIEPILPNGWFRTRQSSSVKDQVGGKNSPISRSSPLLRATSQQRLTTSEKANRVTRMNSFSYLYYNVHTGQATVNRPGEDDPYFIENIDVIQLFNAMEMAKLKEIYDEEMLHFERVSRDRLVHILLEVGERVHPNRIRSVISELTDNEHYVLTFPQFMDIMYTFKMRSLSMR